jgi:Uma2 family endonuclease
MSVAQISVIQKRVSSIRLERKTKNYTLLEYLRKEGKAMDKHEFYNGQIIKIPNAKFNHNLIAANTVSAMKYMVKPLSTKYFVLGDGQKIDIEAENTAVYPDALVICKAPKYYQDIEYIIVNPLLIIEILSRSTAAYDHGRKFDLYKMLPSFKEYVLIDYRKHSVETRFKEDEELWRIKTETNLENTIHLRSIGISISLSDIYENVIFK